MIRQKLFSTLLLFSALGFVKIHADSSIESLLGIYSKKADLSEQTKRESDGYLIVYTRQDLDRMQIRSLKEIIEKIPFIRYNEDRFGLSAPFYSPYQPEPPSGIRVYINDRVLYTPYHGNALKLFGQLDMGYIDHAEVYFGIPTQTLGTEGSIIVIKLYTKSPEREETTLLNIAAGSYGTSEVYGYTASKKEDYAYLVYLDHKNLKRKRVEHGDASLSRDKETSNFYGELHRENHRFELQASRGTLDAFMGRSVKIDPVNPHIDYSYIYGGWYYENRTEGIKAFINLSRNISRHYDESETILEALPSGGAGAAFKTSRFKMTQYYGNVQLKKYFRSGGFNGAFGLQGRTGKFSYSDVEVDGQTYSFPSEYDKETILSIFAEGDYLIDSSNMMVLSLKSDRYLENGDVRDYTLFSGRFGYIHNRRRWTSKSFIFAGDFAPRVKTLYLNRYIYAQNRDPDKESFLILTTKLSYHTTENEFSLFASHFTKRNGLYFDGSGFYNLDDDMVVDSFLIEYTHHISELGYIKTNWWTNIREPQATMPSRRSYGALLGYTETFGSLDLHADLIYKYGQKQKPGWDLNCAATYRYSRRFSIFVKAGNILGKALKSDYYAVDPTTGDITTLNGVDIFDRRFWFGMEYQF